MKNTDLEAERGVKDRPWKPGQLAVAVLCVLSLSQIGYQLRGIKQAIRYNTSITLCLKVWEHGGDTPSCDNLTGKTAQRGDHHKEAK